MAEPLTEEQTIKKRRRWLIVSRLAIATFLLLFAGYLRLRESAYASEISQTPIFVIIFLIYLLSISYFFLARYSKNVRSDIYIQSVCDILAVTALVYYTGGIRSVYPVFYQLIIIYSVLFLERKGGLLIASGCAILYGILVNLQFYMVIYPIDESSVSVDIHDGGYYFFRTLIYILSFYAIAVLASFVVEREKRARALLAEKENAFNQLDVLHRSIIESIDAGILTVNQQKHIKSFNRAAENITGYKKSEVINRGIEEIFHGYSRVLEKLNAARSDELNPLTKRSEIAITAKSGKQLTLGCSVSTLKDRGGDRIGEILIFQDLSNIKMMEEALEKNRRLALIGEMAAGLAHEMRNPMASISGSIQLLRKGLALSEADERLMQVILRGKEQLENFIKDFLLMARPAAGERETCDIRPVIEDVMEALHYIPEWDNRYVIEHDLPQQIILRANRTEIRQILWNLCVNAVQAMPEGGAVSISGKIFQDADYGGRLAISVADTGEGVAGKDRSKIFEPFYTTKDKGTGLGLAIVNRIVERYKGKILVEANAPHGTVFTVELPLQDDLVGVV